MVDVKVGGEPTGVIFENKYVITDIVQKAAFFQPNVIHLCTRFIRQGYSSTNIQSARMFQCEICSQ